MKKKRPRYLEPNVKGNYWVIESNNAGLYESMLIPNQQRDYYNHCLQQTCNKHDQVINITTLLLANLQITQYPTIHKIVSLIPMEPTSYTQVCGRCIDDIDTTLNLI